MPIPTFDQCFRPLLEVLSRYPSRHIVQATTDVADLLALTEAERSSLLPGGGDTVIRNRVGWARTFLNKAGLIEQERRGVWKISADGRRALERHPSTITIHDLRQYPPFMSWVDHCNARREERAAESQRGDTPLETPIANDGTAQTPEHVMGQAEESERRRIEADLLSRLRSESPETFEEIVEGLVIRLGYGSSDEEVRASIRQNGSGDGGVDGVVKMDRLGLDHVFIQAKRYQEGRRTGRPDVQAFVGAMHGRTTRGVFISTSDFTDEALVYAKALQGLRVRLIDGHELAGIMTELGIGVRVRKTYSLYEIDEGFFASGD
jgi:restriction system protein